VTSTFDSAIRDQSPTDLRLANLKRLLAMDCPRSDADAFLSNNAFSPSVQTALVMHLDSMRGVVNRASFIRLAGMQSEGEGDAIFFSQTSAILAQLHANGRTLSVWMWSARCQLRWAPMVPQSWHSSGTTPHGPPMPRILSRS
jgi:hypothetical protein